MKKIFVLCFVLFLAACDFFGYSRNFAELDAVGTEPRLEREYKYVFEGDEDQVVDLIEGLLKEIDLGEEYFFDEGFEDFVFWDLYFDTADGLAYENNIAYRLRERFHGVDEFELGEAHRLEFQAKVGQKFFEDGFGEVMESRLEFWDTSAPFSVLNPAPLPPWDLGKFIGVFKSGRLDGEVFWPAKAVVEALVKAGFDDEYFYFLPELQIVTERHRFHVNRQTPWGSGPNPEQIFIVTVDAAKVYDYEDFGFGLGEMLGSFGEIEVEFERNVSTLLDEEIEAGEVDESVKEEFLADQKLLMMEIVSVLEENLVAVEASNKSKYVRAFEIVNEK